MASSTFVHVLEIIGYCLLSLVWGITKAVTAKERSRVPVAYLFEDMLLNKVNLRQYTFVRLFLAWAVWLTVFVFEAGAMIVAICALLVMLLADAFSKDAV